MEWKNEKYWKYNILPVFSLSLNNPTRHGTIINKVHHPSKKIFILVIPKTFSPTTKPTKINATPKIRIINRNYFILMLSRYY